MLFLLEPFSEDDPSFQISAFVSLHQHGGHGLQHYQAQPILYVTPHQLASPSLIIQLTEQAVHDHHDQLAVNVQHPEAKQESKDQTQENYLSIIIQL